MSSEDAIDIKLTADDVKEMDPSQVVMIHDKLRQSREEAREERDAAREGERRRTEELTRVHSVARTLNEQVQRRNVALSEVAMRMIGIGMMDDLNREGDRD